jgi:hypothetical protein
MEDGTGLGSVNDGDRMLVDAGAQVLLAAKGY